LAILLLVPLVAHLVSEQLFLSLTFSLLLKSLLFGVLGFLSAFLLFLSTLLVLSLRDKTGLLTFILFKHSSLFCDLGLGSVR
jgi:hypothetical protein